MSNNDYVYDNKSITVITTKAIDTPKVVTDKLTVGNTTISNIAHTLNAPSVAEIPSSNAVFSLYKELLAKIGRIDPNDNLFTDNSVVSLPIINRYISDNDWTVNNWEPSLDKRYVYTSRASGTIINSISTAGFIFNRTGEYFINIHVDVLDSGKLHVRDQDNVIIATATAPGDLMFLYKVDLPSISKIHIFAEGVYKNEIIAVSTVDIYYVTQRVKQFLSYYVPETLSKRLSFISEDDLRIALRLFEDEIGLNMYPEPNDMVIAVGHVTRSNANAHNETPESIGAARRDHLHTPDSIGAAKKEHTHTASSVGAADREHTHTPASIDAATSVHTHIPEDCGAAHTYHEHSTYADKSIVAKLSNKYSLPMTVMSGMTHDEHPYIPADGFIKYRNSYLGSSELHHLSKTDIDQCTGYVYSNRIPVSGKLSDSIRLDTTDVCTFSKPTVSDPVILGYKFVTTRPITKYTLYRKLNNDGTIDTTVTVPKKIQLKLSNDVIHEQTLTWIDASDGSNATGVFYLTGADDNATSLELIITEQLDADATSMCVKLKMSHQHDVVPMQSYVVLGNYTRAICSDVDGGMVQMNLPIVHRSLEPDTDPCYQKTGVTIYPYTDGTDVTETPYAPEYAYERTGYPLFSNIPSINGDPLTGTLHEAVTAYGTLSISSASIRAGSNILNLFNCPVDNYDVSRHLFSCNTTSDIDVTDIPNANFIGWRLYVRQRVATTTDNNVPSRIRITYTRTSTKYDGYNGTSIVPIPDRDEYSYLVTDATIADDGVMSYKGYVEHVITDYITSSPGVLINTSNGQHVNGPITGITDMKISLTNTRPGATSNDLYGLKLLFSDDFYDISSGVMYDRHKEVVSNRLYLGQCRKDSIHYNKTYGASYATHPVGSMNRTIVKVDSSGSGRKTLTIPNPYFTTDITVTPKYSSEKDVAIQTLDIITNDSEYTSSELPIFSVVDINCRDITISTTTTVDALVVERNW